MGSALSALRTLFFGKQEYTVYMVGLDGAGKTTILYQLKLGEIVATTPTIGLNIETVESNNVIFTVWDIGGGDKIRHLWRSYIHGMSAVILVVDSGDRNRLEVARAELISVLRGAGLQNVTLLVFANKQDLPEEDKMCVTEISDILAVENFPKGMVGSWNIQPSSGIKAEGIYEGLNWLANQLRQKR